ncbi:MAG: dTMP kinase [Candidatus Levybacteria bacterium]|nr:dTMP kinase [Candidatus Levybacteria bacterium]
MKYHLEFDIEFKQSQYPGLFIALEGIDGSGKSTQVMRIKEKLEEKGRSVLVKNPFEGEIGQFVRRILSGESKVPTVTLQYLIAANRQVQQLEIIEQLKKGNDVIIDRYIWSAVAYGIFDKGVDDIEKTSQWLLVEQSILSMYHRFLMPNYNFYLKISPKVAMERLSKMKKEFEIYEDEEKIKKIAEIYDWLIQQYPDQFIVINGEQPEDAVTNEILSKLPR